MVKIDVSPDKKTGSNGGPYNNVVQAMTTISQKISPMIWFDDQAEEAVGFYTSAFSNSRTGRISRYGKEGFEVHGQKEGTLMTIEFTVDGQKFTALNSGPHYAAQPGSCTRMGSEFF